MRLSQLLPRLSGHEAQWITNESKCGAHITSHHITSKKSRPFPRVFVEWEERKRKHPVFDLPVGNNQNQAATLCHAAPTSQRCDALSKRAYSRGRCHAIAHSRLADSPLVADTVREGGSPYPLTYQRSCSLASLTQRALVWKQVALMDSGSPRPALAGRA
ncbi:hypothetical protein Poly41_16490 [Novipirellula artificiosorum]|uniref:Uncharacterized protein n=1 Tax=Novipirellula artificiosorum TaxID=2528016 RepID=A0A5C6DX75_9BACT|nr:hypothetical protein Poly41_16490 [Novipirellula artificiosorum]